MGFLFEDDLDSLMTDSPHTITVGAVTKKCWFDKFDSVQQDATGGGQIIAVITALVKTDDFPSVKVGDSVVITTSSTPTTYNVIGRLLMGDGATTSLTLGT